MNHYVVFDLDGTLLDTIPDIAGAMNRVLIRHGLSAHPEDAYKAFTGNGAKKLTERAVGDRPELWADVYRDYALEYASHSRERTAPYEGIPQALRDLTLMGIQLIVYSNKDDADTKEVVAHFLKGQAFLEALGARPGVPLKPEPAALRDLLARHSLQPKDGLYVGDTVMDMRCAHAVGIHAVAVSWGFQTLQTLLQEHPDMVIDHPRQLVALAQQRFAASV